MNTTTTVTIITTTTSTSTSTGSNTVTGIIRNISKLRVSLRVGET